MTDLALRPRTSTELVDTAFQVYRRDPVHFLVAAAVVYVPWLVVQLAFDIGVSRDVPTVSQGVVAGIAGLVTYAAVGGATTQIARDVYFDQPVDVARAFRTLGPRLLPLMATVLITLVFITLAILPFGIVAAVMAPLAARVSPLLIIPLVLLAGMVPVLYAIARFFAVRQVVMLEDAGVGRALSRSAALSVDMKRHILLTLVLIFLLVIAVTAGAAMFASVIPSRVLLSVLSTALSIVIYPFFGITETLLYYDVRIRKEGFDIEYMAGREAPMVPADGVSL